MPTDWLTMWAVGRYDLGLTEEEFWGLTPRQYVALLERHEEAMEWEDYRMGVIASTIVNMLKAKGGKTFKPEDFMPTKRRKKQTPEEMLAVVKNYMATVDEDDKPWLVK